MSPADKKELQFVASMCVIVVATFLSIIAGIVGIAAIFEHYLG